MRKIRVGSRGSKLALWQTDYVINELKKKNQDIKFEKIIIKTKGDKILDTALSKVGDKGLFTKELELSLLNNEIDIAVHSMKDVPTNIDDNLIISCVLKREKTEDVFISNKYKSFNDLKPKSIVGTSSLRRKAFLQNKRNDIIYTDIRGNLDTRLRKLDEGQYDAIILAYAGIHRLGLDNRIREFISIEDITPAVGQGAIGIQTRKNDIFVNDIVKLINDEITFKCVSIERFLLNKIEGGCQIPFGCYSYLSDNKIFVKFDLFNDNKKVSIFESFSRELSYVEIGNIIYNKFKAMI
ncbi:MAG: porphobilinogen deaminase [Candidatus Sericytochromatia bacterium]|nr:MAG: porphobilinogen deaminase [Candidatus Sericytochromatia bacterium]